jgi:hypothetical protein
VRFEAPNLVSCAGLVPVLALADRGGLARLPADQLTVAAKGGAPCTPRPVGGPKLRAQPVTCSFVGSR